MQEYLETKRSLAINLAVGAALGVVFASFLGGFALASLSDPAQLQEAVQMGYSPEEATARFAVLFALVCLAAFAYGLFLPLGRIPIKRAKDTLTSGLLLGCFTWLLVQYLYLAAVLLIGSATGVVYLVYSLARMRRAKRSTAVEG